MAVGSSGSRTHVGHAQVDGGTASSQVAHGRELLLRGCQGGLDRGDLTEPSLFLGLSEPVEEIGADPFQPWHLVGANPEERAPDTRVFVRAGGSVVTAAGPEGDFLLSGW